MYCYAKMIKILVGKKIIGYSLVKIFSRTNMCRINHKTFIDENFVVGQVHASIGRDGKCPTTDDEAGQ